MAIKFNCLKEGDWHPRIEDSHRRRERAEGWELGMEINFLAHFFKKLFDKMGFEL